MTGVDEHQLEIVFKDVPDRPPIDTRGLHHDLRRVVRSQPIAQRQQPPDRRLKLGQMRLAAPIGGRDTHTRSHAGLVDIQRPDALDDHVHHNPLASITGSPSARACEIKESEERARAATVRSSGTDPHAKLDDGLASAIVGRRPQTTRRSCHHGFHPTRAGRTPRGTSTGMCLLATTSPMCCSSQ